MALSTQTCFAQYWTVSIYWREHKVKMHDPLCSLIGNYRHYGAPACPSNDKHYVWQNSGTKSKITISMMKNWESVFFPNKSWYQFLYFWPLTKSASGTLATHVVHLSPCSLHSWHITSLNNINIWGKDLWALCFGWRLTVLTLIKWIFSSHFHFESFVFHDAALIAV